MESPRGGGALGSRGYKEAKKGEGIVCACGWVGWMEQCWMGMGGGQDHGSQTAVSSWGEERS